MLKVLIVDDSDTSRRLLAHIIASASDMQVVGEAKNGQQAVDMVEALRPNVILMDITMPLMDGLEATQEIMSKTPTPIVMVSGSLDERETDVAFQAIKRGALTLLAKPTGPSDPSFQDQVDRLVRTVRTMAGVRVIRHYQSMKAVSGQPLRLSSSLEICVIAASTGGPSALSEIMRALPPDFPLPVVVAQHMAADFVPSLCSWLNTLTPLKVQIAQEGDSPKPGNVYFVSGPANVVITREGRFAFDHSRVTRYIPSCDVLLESVAQRYGRQAIGIVLTGMGDDSAQGLLKMAQAGAVTIAQDEATSIVYGMPKEAAALGAAKFVLPLPQIASTLMSLISEKGIPL
jgi:two-component system, chemotaxis family, protein-glutamate methylesterase/glutaminase